MGKRYVVVFAGPSGSGKNVLQQNLVDSYPDKFNLMRQVTTRPKRNDDDPYIFIDQTTYGYLRPSLIGATHINGNNYGTLPELSYDKINTVILNLIGYTNMSAVDIPMLLSRHGESAEDIEILVIGLDHETTDTLGREDEGRGQEYVNKEKEELRSYSDIIMTVTGSGIDKKYITPKDVYDKLIELEFAPEILK